MYSLFDFFVRRRVANPLKILTGACPNRPLNIQERSIRSDAATAEGREGCQDRHGCLSISDHKCAPSMCMVVFMFLFVLGGIRRRAFTELGMPHLSSRVA